MNTLDIALKAFDKHRATHCLGHYTGIVTVHGLCRITEGTGNSSVMESALQTVRDFQSRVITVEWCNYENYRCGGNGAAWLFWKGLMPEAESQIRQYAEQLLHEAPKSEEGLVVHPKIEPRNRVFIDQVFAICPFLTFAGRALNEETYLREAARQCIGIVDLLLDESCGLLNQSINFRQEGKKSDDHWSRGNGWGIYALAELACYLPDSADREACISRFRDLVAACLKVQDADGMWHQEMTRDDSYVETSGTGLILYAIGLGLEHGLFGDAERKAFIKGLNGYLTYIALDGSVHHTCRGCLAPGQGTIDDYMNTPAVLNDPHAFGPVALALGQAHRLGITTLSFT